MGICDNIGDAILYTDVIIGFLVSFLKCFSDIMQTEYFFIYPKSATVTQAILA